MPRPVRQSIAYGSESLQITNAGCIADRRTRPAVGSCGAGESRLRSSASACASAHAAVRALSMASRRCKHGVERSSPIDAARAIDAVDYRQPRRTPPLGEQPFAATPLSRAMPTARELLVADWRERLRDERAAELARGEITIGEHTMPIFYKTFGEQARGRPQPVHLDARRRQRAGSRQRPAVAQPAAALRTRRRRLRRAASADRHWNLWHEPHIDGCSTGSSRT